MGKVAAAFSCIRQHLVERTRLELPRHPLLETRSFEQRQVTNNTLLTKALQPSNCNRRRTTRPRGSRHVLTSICTDADSPACTLRAVWGTARRPDAPVRRPRPARRRRSLQQLRGAFMATPSCSPRRRRRGNRDRGRPTRQRLPTTIGAGPGRRRAGALTRRSMPGQPGGLPVDPKTRSFEGQAAGP